MSKKITEPITAGEEDKKEFRAWLDRNVNKIETFEKSPSSDKVLLFSLAEFWYENVNSMWHKTLELVEAQRELINREIPLARRQGALAATLANWDAITAQGTRTVGGRLRGEQQTKEKEITHAAIQDKERELAATVPKHKLNKEIARATGLEVEYVRKARKEICKKSG